MPTEYFFVPKYSSKYGKKQQTEKQQPVPEMGWQPGAVNSNFALQSSALIPIGSFVWIIKVDSNAKAASILEALMPNHCSYR
ncbi:hypothetical protein [Porphyromonas gingivalis]|uniref:hypothetical protein n=1 Tax=Porphyromonas gingivalis TaxID=837 RepID=UPI000ABE4077|nr:hypothetical protein [Porphyromonas gingivalis]